MMLVIERCKLKASARYSAGTCCAHNWVTTPMRIAPAIVLAASVAGIGSARAAPSTAPLADDADETPASVVEPSDPAPADPKPRSPTWQIAAGLFVNVGPTYGGSATQKASLQVGYYVRRGRWSLTNRSDLVTSQGEQVLPGLAADLLEQSKVRLAASLRIDNGREASVDPALLAKGDVQATLRLRLLAESRWPGPWQGSLALSSDMLHRGGGNTLALRVWRDWGFGPRMRLNVGAGVNAGDSTFMQSWYGVSEATAERLGVPAYRPSVGLTDITLGGNLRWELDDPWVVFGSGGISQMLGPASSSPLTQRAGGWSLNAGLSRHF
jgi:hypothetical protein